MRLLIYNTLIATMLQKWRLNLYKSAISFHLVSLIFVAVINPYSSYACVCMYIHVYMYDQLQVIYILHTSTFVHCSTGRITGGTM